MIDTIMAAIPIMAAIRAITMAALSSSITEIRTAATAITTDRFTRFTTTDMPRRTTVAMVEATVAAAAAMAMVATTAVFRLASGSNPRQIDSLNSRPNRLATRQPMFFSWATLCSIQFNRLVPVIVEPL